MAGSVYRLPGPGARMFAVVDYNHAIDQNMINAGRILLWILEGRLIDHRFRVKDHHIGPIEIPAANKPSTSARLSPQSARAPRADSAMICDSLFSGAQRVGCSQIPATAIDEVRETVADALARNRERAAAEQEAIRKLGHRVGVEGVDGMRGVINETQIFASHVASDRLMSVVEHFFGPWARVSCTDCVVNHPGCGRGYWHADWPYNQEKDVISELGADIEQRNIWENSEWQRQLVDARGSSSVPVLCRETPDGEVEWLSESDAIIRYLIQNCDSTN